MTNSSSNRLGIVSYLRTALVLIASVVCLLTCSSADATIFKTYITGETDPGTAGEKHVIFTVTFDPAVPLSGTVVTTLEDSVHRLDGIDFIPGTGKTEVVAAGTHLVGADGFVGRYDVAAGVVLLPSYFPSTKSAPVPPPRTTHPSTVKATDTHFYFVENQFGFEAADPHRIMRAPFGAAPPIPAAEVVLDSASSGGLVQYEGIEIHDGRMYFFALDPATADPALKRALFSVPLSPGGLPTGAPVKKLGGLTRGSGLTGVGPSVSDGSDELDYDPFTGLIWGTNIISGELIAYDPVADVGAVVVSAGDVTGGDPGGLGLLGMTINGIRSTGDGHLVFVGLEGIVASIDLSGFIGGGGLGLGTITDADVKALIFAPGDYAFDDLTPLDVVVPEPSTFLLLALGVSGLVVVVCRRRRRS